VFLNNRTSSTTQKEGDKAHKQHIEEAIKHIQIALEKLHEEL
jgi:hypothetical protein